MEAGAGGSADQPVRKPCLGLYVISIALDGVRATFLFVQARDETESAVGTWDGQHAALSAALDVVGRGEVVVVGRDPARLAAAGGCSTSGR